MSSPSDRRYSRAHEWVMVVDARAKRARVGITDHAQGQLGSVVFVQLPGSGTTLAQGDGLGTIESVKAVSELYAPVSGKVTQTNPKLTDDPETVNTDPYGEGWMIEVTMSDPTEVDGLLTAAQYEAYLTEE
jgi:glycine cleavage system H protein